MIDFRLYLVTDRRALKAASLEIAVLDACKAGARALQVRERDLEGKSLLHIAEGLRRITAARNASLFVNDRVDVALAVGADGVHCPGDSFTPAAVRRIAASKPMLVGASTHSIEGAVEAEKSGADFVTFGPVFETPSKTKYGPPQGLDNLRDVARAVEIPVFAIGGVTPERAARCLEHGAWGVAAISAVFASGDVGGAVAAFERELGSL